MVPYANTVYIATDYSLKPNRTRIAHNHISNEGSVVSKKTIFAIRRRVAQDGFD
jgi:hypothetical protein